MSASAALLLLLGPQSAADDSILTARGDVIDIRIDDQLIRGLWTLPAVPEAETAINTPAIEEGETQHVCLAEGASEVCRDIAIGDEARLAVRNASGLHRALFVGRGPAATFDAAYREAHAGQLRIGVPSAYELVNIAIALTPYAQADRRLVVGDTDYARAVEAHFGRFRGHPFVVALDRAMVEDRDAYHGLKMNGVAFDLLPGDRIVRSAVYDRTWNRNDLLPFLDAMRAFATDTQFGDFYSKHRSHYAEQADTLRHAIGVERMLEWLPRQFPGVEPYDSVNILFSPLVASNQSLATFEDEDFRELQPHVNFPYPSDGDPAIGAAGLATYRGLILFTELNHGFIADAQAPYEGRIAEALSDRAAWAEPGTSADSYRGPSALFNEMMNWGLIALYFEDVAPPVDRAAMVDPLSRIMVGRGFRRAPAFHEFLLELYRNRPPGTPVAALYPQIVRWIETAPAQ